MTGLRWRKGSTESWGSDEGDNALVVDDAGPKCHLADFDFAFRESRKSCVEVETVYLSDWKEDCCQVQEFGLTRYQMPA